MNERDGKRMNERDNEEWVQDAGLTMKKNKDPEWLKMSIVKEEFDDTSGRLDQRRFLGYPKVNADFLP